ncbi:hypothetical protein CASFOL_034787 [Castilleja foliolosa]|uniref:DEAD-box RNA helicase Q domain-containing protein n=1 Tax=Castilleja foliolosa TaxID=1961234 RepID=A0ABD3BQV9_9LAMI
MVSGTIRNCCFEAENQLQNLLLISEFLWPALLLPVAGNKIYSEQDTSKMPLELASALSIEREPVTDPEIRIQVLDAIYLLALQAYERGAIKSEGLKRGLQSMESCDYQMNEGSVISDSGDIDEDTVKELEHSYLQNSLDKEMSELNRQLEQKEVFMGWFDKCNISPLSLKAIKDAGYERMTLVQEATLPVILNGKDVLAKARTGTGKTVAFLSPCMMGVGTDYGNDEEKVRLWSMKIGTKPMILAEANAQAAKNKVTRLQSTMEPLRYGVVVIATSSVCD